jgi:glutaredoxin
MDVRFEIVSKEGCKYCDKLRDFFDERGIAYEETKLRPSDDSYGEQRDEVVARAGGDHRTFPFVFAKNSFVGGYDDTVAFVEKENLRGTSLAFDDEF